MREQLRGGAEKKRRRWKKGDRAEAGWRNGGGGGGEVKKEGNGWLEKEGFCVGLWAKERKKDR